MKSAIAAFGLACALVPQLAAGAVDVALQMTVDVPVPAPGQTVQFTVTASNVGTSAATGVEVTDKLPVGLTTPAGLAAFPSVGTYDAGTGVWSIGSLAAGAHATLILPAVVVASPQPACLVNVADSTGPADSDAQNDRTVAAVKSDAAVRCVDLQLSPANVWTNGCTGSYTLNYSVHLTNAGPDAATDVYLDLLQSPVVAPNLHFSGSNCSGLRCSYATLAPGSTVVAIASSDPFDLDQARTVTFTATASSGDTDYATGDNQRQDEVRIAKTPSCFVVDEGWSGIIVVGGCFIATAAYGSPLEPHVVALRQFRDRYLQQSAPGRAFIRFYYRHSPPIAAVIARHAWLRFAVRLLLTPLVMAVEFPLHALALLLTSGIGLYAGVRPIRRAR